MEEKAKQACANYVRCRACKIIGWFLRPLHRRFLPYQILKYVCKILNCIKFKFYLYCTILFNNKLKINKLLILKLFFKSV